jgi:glycerol uptake facilitator-like aquaporin
MRPANHPADGATVTDRHPTDTRHPARAGLARRLVAEALGTALLLAAIVGSGIMAERLADGNVALALLANTLATGAGLAALILTFGPISGAHFNPVVTLADALQGGLSWRDAPWYVVAQIVGGILGVAATNMMYDLPALHVAHHERAGVGLMLGEFVATFGLLSVIWGCVSQNVAAVPFAVAGYVMAAIWFTSSTSFANPAVTIARALSDTFTGIRPDGILPFIAAQVLGGLAATFLFRWLVPSLPADADRVVVPHDE